MKSSSSSTDLTIPDSPSKAAATRNNVPIVNPKGLSPMGFLDSLKVDIPMGPPPATPSPYFPIFPSEGTNLFRPPKYFKDPDGEIANYRHPAIPVESQEKKSNSDFQDQSSSSRFVFVFFFFFIYLFPAMIVFLTLVRWKSR